MSQREQLSTPKLVEYVNRGPAELETPYAFDYIPTIDPVYRDFVMRTPASILVSVPDAVIQS